MDYYLQFVKCSAETLNCYNHLHKAESLIEENYTHLNTDSLFADKT